MHCCRKAIRWISLPRSGRRTKGKSRCFMWRMTMMPSYQSGFGNVYSLKSNVEKSTWRSMGQTPIPTGRKAIHSHPRKFAETVYKVFARKGWRSSTGIDRKVWQCSERYKVKGVMGWIIATSRSFLKCCNK